MVRRAQPYLSPCLAAAKSTTAARYRSSGTTEIDPQPQFRLQSTTEAEALSRRSPRGTCCWSRAGSAFTESCATLALSSEPCAGTTRTARARRLRRLNRSCSTRATHLPGGRWRGGAHDRRAAAERVRGVVSRARRCNGGALVASVARRNNVEASNHVQLTFSINGVAGDARGLGALRSAAAQRVVAGDGAHGRSRARARGIVA
jgi:hypothetical protein